MQNNTNATDVAGKTMITYIPQENLVDLRTNDDVPRRIFRFLFKKIICYHLSHYLF